ncbi:MAG: type sorting protein [Bacteroidetes bacterium]|jgi:N-acetylneuraminic acid mutarotase|nr:type sorting protein [Bacteroidota bacterium]
MKKNYRSAILIIALLLTCSALSFSQGWWYRKTDVNLTARSAAVGFTVGTGGFIGTGFDSADYKRNFGIYNQLTDTWGSAQSVGGSTGAGLSRNAAAAFVIGTKAYICTGQGSNPHLNDLWEYNAGTDTWTQKANFGGTPRRSAVGFSINGKGYVTCGQDISGLKKDLWMYDPSLNSWTAKTSFPGTPRRLPVAFVINNIAYVGTGDDGAFKKDFYKYDGTANSWTAISDFGGTPRYGATAFIISTDGYVGTGYDNTLSNRKDFWKYNSILNTWIAITDFAGSPRSNAVAFAIGSYGYVATGYDSLPRNDLWRYDPVSNGMIELDKLRASVKVYPNPMLDHSTVKFDSESLNAFARISFIIYDINGREMKHITQIENAEFNIDRDQMSAGIYIYKLMADGKTVSAGKIVVQ